LQGFIEMNIEDVNIGEKLIKILDKINSLSKKDEF
jgi:hypothetical protein